MQYIFDSRFQMIGDFDLVVRLSIVNKIINDHNGELEFISIPDGAKIEINFKFNVN